MFRVASVLAAFALAATAFAHDFWIAPTRFRAEVNSLVGLHLQVGHLPKGDPFPRSQAKFERFVVAEPSGTLRDVPGKEGATPAGVVRVTEPGLYVIGYRSLPTPITLEAANFEEYLKEEGLNRIVQERAARGETAAPGRERFSRSAKSIIAVGSNPEAAVGFDRVLGFRMEIVAESNPFAVKAGEEFSARVLFDNAPLEGVEIHAASVEAPDEVVRVRSDSQGRIRVKLTREGHWMLNSVHMVRLTSADAEWESVWSSLTFATAGAKFDAATQGDGSAASLPPPPPSK